MNDFSTIVPTAIDLGALAQALALPVSVIAATTSLTELARLYDAEHLHAKLLSSSFAFHLCPACIAEERKLSRLLALPHITHCPQHQLSLVKSCQCGAPLRLFHRQAQPFSCHKCGLDWRNLSQPPIAPERLEMEQYFLSFYDFFLTKGTPELLASTLRLIYDSVVEKGKIRAPLPNEDAQASSDEKPYHRSTSLGYLVHSLWQLDLSPRDVLVYAGPLPWRSIKWMTFQCPEPACPYVAMIQDRTAILDDAEDQTR
jgi:hypothetical protein